MRNGRNFATGRALHRDLDSFVVRGSSQRVAAGCLVPVRCSEAKVKMLTGNVVEPAVDVEHQRLR